MIYLRKFSINCPEGYLPIQRPKTWNVVSGNAYAPKPPVLEFTLNWVSEMDDQAVIETMTKCLMNLYEVSSICMSQLAKSPVNDFLIGISDSVMADIKAKSLGIGFRATGMKVNISVSDLFIFQRVQKTSRM